MQPLLRIRRFGVALTLFIALCTAMLGFAHRAPSVQAAELEAYAVAGYDVSDICGDLETGGGDHCPACHLVGGAILPDPVSLLRDADLRLVAEVVAPRESRAAHRVRDPGLGLRAPPAA